MRLVLLGLPGAGKGTQGDLIAQKYGIPHISSGSLIREAVASGTPVGREVDSYIRKGELIPDGLAIEMISERIGRADCSQGWILDGFPRTVLQAIALDQRLAQIDLDVQMAFDIRITQEEAIERIAKRRMCSKCGAPAARTLFMLPLQRILCGVAAPTSSLRSVRCMYWRASSRCSAARRSCGAEWTV